MYEYIIHDIIYYYVPNNSMYYGNSKDEQFTRFICIRTRVHILPLLKNASPAVHY